MVDQNLTDLNKLFDLKLEKSIEFSTKINSFEHSIKIYINKPQVINNWLAGSIKLAENECNLQSCLQQFEFVQISQHYQVEFREFITKSNKIFSNIKYLIVSDFDRASASSSSNTVVFFPLMDDGGKSSSTVDTKYASIEFAHSFQYDAQTNRISLFVPGDLQLAKQHSQVRWLTENLLPKLHSWCLNIKVDEEFSCAKQTTLTLYENMLNDYSNMYQRLKDVYWNRFSPIWYEYTKTNPEKFIHEDVSIACYLILAWKHFKVNVKSFVDMGCGNGLLVYILNDQGYHGYGVDIRKRKIWSNEFYQALNVKLVEETVDPCQSVYDDCDWLIGNHSDELSPWLPIMAFKGRSNFFLIPCCLFDFYTKFETKADKQSRYETYLDYLSEIFHKFNFKFHRDKLRIPSTKNVCFTCFNNNNNNQIQQDDEITYINEQINALTLSKANTNEFKARDLELEKLKSSRNCTRNVPNDLKMLIVQKCLSFLLNNDSADCKFMTKHDGAGWNSGRVVTFDAIVTLFDKDVLNKLKLECGGIKTLLKNFHQLFLVFDKDKVCLKLHMNPQAFKVKSEPISVGAKTSDEQAERKKTRDCLYDLYHPDGCLLADQSCSFLHKSEKTTEETTQI